MVKVTFNENSLVDFLITNRYIQTLLACTWLIWSPVWLEVISQFWGVDSTWIVWVWFIEQKGCKKGSIPDEKCDIKGQVVLQIHFVCRYNFQEMNENDMIYS